jgi:hypothetical protein
MTASRDIERRLAGGVNALRELTGACLVGQPEDATGDYSAVAVVVDSLAAAASSYSETSVSRPFISMMPST